MKDALHARGHVGKFGGSVGVTGVGRVGRVPVHCSPFPFTRQFQHGSRQQAPPCENVSIVDGLQDGSENCGVYRHLPSGPLSSMQGPAKIGGEGRGARSEEEEGG